MNAAAIIRAAPRVPARPWPRHLLSPDGWRSMADALGADPSPALLALWADAACVHALFEDALAEDGGPLLASVPIEAGLYAALSPYRPAAAWFERMVLDLWGHAAAGATDPRPWLDHGRWPVLHPMSPRPVPHAVQDGGAPEPTEFLPAEGEDLHRVPVGPVRGGITEPGHFRFTASGETVVRLETRLGYAHKGTLDLMRGKPPGVAARLAARLSGDSTVAHSVAFARAVEAALGVEAPPRAHALRGVMAELERVANHLGDIAAILDGAAFALGHARFGQHREAMLRAADAAFGHRLMMDRVVPGGVAVDLAPGGADAMLGALDAMLAELPELIGLIDGSASLADRLVGIGVVAPVLAARLAPGGVVGRASGQGRDARAAPGYPPYAGLPFTAAVRAEGDADARVRVRLAEVQASVGLLCALLAALPPGPLAAGLPGSDGGGSGEGLGVAESFRGDVWHWLRLEGGVVAASFAADPSWRQWPLVEAAMAGGTVADFPLILGSMNPSCSGVDL